VDLRRLEEGKERWREGKRWDEVNVND